MNSFSVILALIFICSFSEAQIVTPNLDKVVNLHTVDEDILIDGVIDPIWSQADSAISFFQLQPYFNQPPSVKTIAKVLTTNEALYCLMICFEEAGKIQQTTGMLDQFSGDIVSIMLDTFGDNKTAYKFAVTASGGRADSRLLDDARNRDYSWDGIWFAESKIYDWGYVVEIQIPYKSIQYDETLTEWGIDFDRWFGYNSEDIYWCEYEQNEGQRISKFGTLLLNDFKPLVKGLNLEIYPVAIGKLNYSGNEKYDFDPAIGIDLLYNPSQKLKFLLTVNPDFAQIEADPFTFNISRYETFFSERRPFFTEGSEVFNASGRQNNTGFYRPLELFYSRRIGKKLPGGKEVPLNFGTKAFGRIGDWEYGGFISMTGETDYSFEGQNISEPKSIFGSARIKKQIFQNSTIGVLFVGKKNQDNIYGVIDIDGALRESTWQLSYQFARSIKNEEGDFAGSAGFTMFGENWINLARVRFVGNDFDINEVGFVPWRGTTEFAAITGPSWYFDEGYIRQILFYGGFAGNYEKIDAYTDMQGIVGFNIQFRDNWGYEITFGKGKTKDAGKTFSSYDLNFSSWFNISPVWNGNLWGGYSKTYNFSRDFLAFYAFTGASIAWDALNVLNLGSDINIYVEGNPEGSVEDITYNMRPYAALTPFNNFSLRIYVDNVYVRSTDKLESIIFGLLFSYNFSPKSWIYFAFNEFRDRSIQFDFQGNSLPVKLHVTDRAAVIKIKYLYYF